eukprot:310295-Chlamydomonas_euryale.AAC.2
MVAEAGAKTGQVWGRGLGKDKPRVGAGVGVGERQAEGGGWAVRPLLPVTYKQLVGRLNQLERLEMCLPRVVGPCWVEPGKGGCWAVLGRAWESGVLGRAG